MIFYLAKQPPICSTWPVYRQKDQSSRNYHKTLVPMKNTLKKKIVLRRALLAAIVILPSIAAFATELDLSGSATSGSLTGAVGGTAIFSETSTHPAGTGVFDPFLTINSQGNSRI